MGGVLLFWSSTACLSLELPSLTGFLQYNYTDFESGRSETSIKRARLGIQGWVSSQYSYYIVYGAKEMADKQPYLVQSYI